MVSFVRGKCHKRITTSCSRRVQGTLVLLGQDREIGGEKGPGGRPWGLAVLITSLLPKSGLVSGLGSGESAREVKLGGDALDTVGRVDVLDKGELVAGGGTLAGDDGGGSKEVLPDLRACLLACRDTSHARQQDMGTHPEPSLAVLGLDLLAVAHPVSVPPPESGRVVNADGVNVLDFEASALKLVDEETKRGRSVGAGEDVLVHEETPDEILVLPGLPEAGNLEEEDTIVLKHVVDLAEEGGEVANTDVLGHLETGNSLVLALWDGDITVVHAENLALLLRDAVLAKTVVAPGSLVATKRDTSDVSTVVDTGKLGQGTPATADVEHAVALLQLNLLADNRELVVLKLLQRFFLVDVGDDTRGVDHARTEEPTVEVITTVVVVADLLLICELSAMYTGIG